MRRRDRALWALAAVFCSSLLMAPAFWNGFALLQYDAEEYLARWYEGTLVPSRAVTYGLILDAGAAGAFWPVLMLQALLTVWVIALTLQAHEFGRPLRRSVLSSRLSRYSPLSPGLPRSFSLIFSPVLVFLPFISCCCVRET